MKEKIRYKQIVMAFHNSKLYVTLNTMFSVPFTLYLLNWKVGNKNDVIQNK